MIRKYFQIIGHISFDAKQPGKPGAGKLHAGFDEAGVGNVMVMGIRLRPKVKTMDMPLEPFRSARANSRPYLRGAGGEVPPAYSPPMDDDGEWSRFCSLISPKLCSHTRCSTPPTFYKPCIEKSFCNFTVSRYRIMVPK